MNDQSIVLSSLAMDLKRAALAFWRGSTGVAQKFLGESLERKKEINMKEIDPYISNVLKDINNKDAEDLLMYSILIQNYVRKNGHDSRLAP